MDEVLGIPNLRSGEAPGDGPTSGGRCGCSSTHAALEATREASCRRSPRLPPTRATSSATLTQILVLEILRHFKLAPAIRAGVQDRVVRSVSEAAPRVPPSSQNVRDR